MHGDEHPAQRRASGTEPRRGGVRGRGTGPADEALDHARDHQCGGAGRSHDPQRDRDVGGHHGESDDGHQRQHELRGDVQGVGQDAERGERQVGVPPGAHHAPVQPGRDGAPERDHVGDGTAAQVEQQAPAYAESRQRRGQHGGVQTQATEPDRREREHLAGVQGRQRREHVAPRGPGHAVGRRPETAADQHADQGRLPGPAGPGTRPTDPSCRALGTGSCPRLRDGHGVFAGRGNSVPPVVVLEADDVVLAGVGTDLDLEDDQLVHLLVGDAVDGPATGRRSALLGRAVPGPHPGRRWRHRRRPASARPGGCGSGGRVSSAARP